MGQILKFYKEETPNNSGLYYKDILMLPDKDLENNHRYIQWLFPLKERSKAVPNAPILDEEDILAFKEDAVLKDKLIEAMVRMMHFYGFYFIPTVEDPDELDVLGILGIQDPNKLRKWVTPHNHNFLRLSRILQSLRLLGCKKMSEKLYDLLCEIYKTHERSIGKVTKQFWDESMEIE
jgi:hypothetical protein